MSDLHYTMIKVPVFGLEDKTWEIRNKFLDDIRRNYGIESRYTDNTCQFCWIPWVTDKDGKFNFSYPPSRFFYDDKAPGEKQYITVPAEKTFFQKIKGKIRTYRLLWYLKKNLKKDFENNEN